MKKVIVSLLALVFVALAATGTVSAQCAAKPAATTGTRYMRCDDVRSVYELPKDFSVSYDDVRSVYELPKDFSVSYDDVRSVYELPKDFSVSYDDDEVRELSDNDEVRELSDNDEVRELSDNDLQA